MSANDASIKRKIQEYVKSDRMFTSVDISNALKREGIWVRNREVTMWLRGNFNSNDLFKGWAMETISVNGGSTNATLYYPGLKDPSEYQDVDQTPLTPDEVREIQKKKVGTTRQDVMPDIDSLLKNKNDDEEGQLSTIIRSQERIKIPGEIIRQLGWVPGQSIDPHVIKSHKILSSSLKVNNDYRVSIPRSAVSWGTDPIKVMLKDGEVIFEKA